MAFTGDDLQRLKEECKLHKHESCCDLMDLIARLEAAEDLIGIPIGSTTWKEKEPVWRKAAGK